MFVYLIVNRQNDKIYTGKTVTRNLGAYLRGKIRDAGGRYNGRSHLFRAMVKYPSYVWEIFPLISSLKTDEELCFWERVLIAEYDSQNPILATTFVLGVKVELETEDGSLPALIMEQRAFRSS